LPDVTDHLKQVSLFDALSLRRSHRELSTRSYMSRERLAAIVWSAQGISDTSRFRKRTAPSAGALYPIKLYVVVSRVDGLPAGVYEYSCDRHALVSKEGVDNPREALPRVAAACRAEWVRDAEALLVVVGTPALRHKYHGRSVRYVWVEAGAATQNALLAAASLGTAATVVGAFDDEKVAQAVGDDLTTMRYEEEGPIVLIALGHPV